MYYAAIVLAEAFGKTNTSRIIDLWGNAGSTSTPSYAIYENGRLSKVALFNYMDDATGASDLKVTLQVPTGVPGVVKVKYELLCNIRVYDLLILIPFSLRYLEAKSVSSRENITWAGQVSTTSISNMMRLLKLLTDVRKPLRSRRALQGRSQRCHRDLRHPKQHLRYPGARTPIRSRVLRQLHGAGQPRAGNRDLFHYPPY